MISSIPCYVINLKRRPDRLVAFQKKCPFTNVEVIYGFDSKVSENESDEEKAMYKQLNMSRPGESGCFISHFRIYKKMISENIDFACIFEDDAFFSETFLDTFSRSVNERPSNTDILYIGGRFSDSFRMRPEYYERISNTIVKYRDTIWNGPMMDRTTHAYCISKSMAEKMVESYERIKYRPIDHWIFDVLRSYKIPIYSLDPLICHSPISNDSDIRC